MRPKLLFFPFALIVFVWSFVSLTKPAWTEYQTDKGKLQKLLTEKQSLVKGIANVKKALAQFKQVPDDTKKKLYNAMPQVINNDNLVAEINKNASQSGVMIVSVGTKKAMNRNASKCKSKTTTSKSTNTAKTAKTDCSLTAVPVNVSLSAIGTYPMIKDFLNKLDTQNRVIIPQNFSLASVNDKQNNKDKEQATAIELVSSKLSFDVFQKQQNNKIILSKAIDSDQVLKSLLSGGLSKKGLEALNNMISSEIFYPVTADGAGKENLFEQTTETAGSAENVQ